MKVFCNDCHAVYFRDDYFDECENILCKEKVLHIDDDNLDLVLELKKKCCQLFIDNHMNLLGSVYFVKFGLMFCSMKDAMNFYEQSMSSIELLELTSMFDFKIFSSDEHHIVTVEYIGYDDLFNFEDLDRVQVVMEFKDALIKIFVPAPVFEETPSDDLKRPVKVVATGEID